MVYFLQAKGDRLPTTQSGSGKKQTDKKQVDKKQADKKPADKKPADKKPTEKKPAEKKQADKKTGTRQHFCLRYQCTPNLIIFPKNIFSLFQIDRIAIFHLKRIL